jgi:hypothetical protein
VKFRESIRKRQQRKKKEAVTVSLGESRREAKGGGGLTGEGCDWEKR